MSIRTRQAIMVSAIVAAPLALLAGQQSPASQYTAAQASAGRAAYQTSCAVCHAESLKGSGDAPSLAGSQFMAAWGRRTTRELVSFLQTKMPPDQAGVLL